VCVDACTVTLNIPPVLRIAFAPQSAGACTAPIQPSALFWSVVGTNAVEPAGSVTVADTGTAIVPPAPPPLGHVAGRTTR